MIGVFDTLTGSPCFLCGDPLERGRWTLAEAKEDQWEVICHPCDDIAGVSEGK